jgi:hypothetical protein
MKNEKIILDDVGAWDDISDRVMDLYASIIRRKAKTTDADELKKLDAFYRLVSDYFGPMGG